MRYINLHFTYLLTYLQHLIQLLLCLCSVSLNYLSRLFIIRQTFRQLHELCIFLSFTKWTTYVYDQCSFQLYLTPSHAPLSPAASRCHFSDRDGHETSMAETETRPRRDRDVWPHQPRRYRDETFTFRDETETRRLQVSRRDRDVEVHVYCH